MKLYQWLSKLIVHRDIVFAIVWLIFAITDAATGYTIAAIGEVIASALFFYMYQMDRKEWK